MKPMDLSARVVDLPGAEFQPGARQWQGIPGLECASNGRLWATWYTGTEGEGPGNHVVVATCPVTGGAWTDPVTVVEPPDDRHRCFDPCLWIDPLKRLWLFWAQCGGGQHFDGRGGVWCIRSEDASRPVPQWSVPRRLCDGVMMNKPTVLSTGEWMLPAALWRFFGGDWADLDTLRYSNVVVSTDAGVTWTRRGGADVPDRHYDEHMVVERKDGTLWMLVRTKPGLSGMGESVSLDRGATWLSGKATKAPLTGPNSRFFIRRLQSGRLLLVTHLRTDRRSDLAAMLSDDDGITWTAPLMLDERPGVSYPDGVQRADGRIVIVYDHNRGDKYSLGKDREILMADITEQDILAGRLVDPESKLRLVISRVP